MQHDLACALGMLDTSACLIRVRAAPAVWAKRHSNKRQPGQSMTLQPEAALFSTAQHSTAWHSTAWNIHEESS